MPSVDIKDPSGKVVATLNAPDGATPDQIRAKAAEVKQRFLASPTTPTAGPPGTPASFADVRASLQSPEARQAAQSVVPKMLGGGIGAAVGLATGGPAGALYGAGTGAGLGQTAADLVAGKVDVPRALAVGGATALSQALPFTRALGLGKQVLVGAISSAGAGRLWDMLRQAEGAKEGPQTAGEATLGGVQDAIGGGLGVALNAAGQNVYGRNAPQSRSVLPPEEQQFREQYAAQRDIPLSASGRTGSVMAAKIEKGPGVFPTGRPAQEDFYGRQLEATERTIHESLGRIDALAEQKTPAAAGLRVQDELPKLVDNLDKAAEQGYKAVKQSFRPGVSTEVQPTNFVARAREVLADEARSPLESPVPAGRIIAKNTETRPAAPVLFGPTGKPITLPQIAASDKPLTYDQAVYYLRRMGSRTFSSSDPLVGDIDSSIKKSLWAALKQDIEGMLGQHPESQELFHWVNEGYGATKERLNLRLQKLADIPDVEKVVGNLIKPGMTQRAMQMKEILPREIWDDATGAVARDIYESATIKTPTGTQFSPAVFAAKWRPYIKSGQLDVMYDPETAQQIKDFVRFEPALQSTERIAGNPSRSGEIGGNLLQGSGLWALLSGHPGTGAALLAGPPAAGKAIFSGPGIEALSALARTGPAIGRATIANPVAALASGYGYGGMAPGSMPPEAQPFIDWLRRQGVTGGGGAP